MNLLDELLARRIVSSKRDLARKLERAENRFCGPDAGFTVADLVALRRVLLDQGQHDLAARVTQMIVEPWTDDAPREP